MVHLPEQKTETQRKSWRSWPAGMARMQPRSRWFSLLTDSTLLVSRDIEGQSLSLWFQSATFQGKQNHMGWCELSHLLSSAGDMAHTSLWAFTTSSSTVQTSISCQTPTYNETICLTNPGTCRALAELCLHCYFSICSTVCDWWHRC